MPSAGIRIIVMPIDFAALPKSLADYENYSGPLEFPYLEPNTPESCPREIDDIAEYAEIEADIPRENLRFVRTGNVDDVKFWVWEDSGLPADEKVYVSVEQYEDSVMLNSDWDSGWLTPEKYMAYHYATDWR